MAFAVLPLKSVAPRSTGHVPHLLPPDQFHSPEFFLRSLPHWFRYRLSISGSHPDFAEVRIFSNLKKMPVTGVV
jgi:hypothetical protein